MTEGMAMRGGMIVGALAGLLVLAGCSNGEEQDAEAAGGEGETLQDFFGMGGDPEEMQARFEDEQRQVEERIAECMAQEGFEYIPRDPSGGMMTVTHPSQEMSEEEFREEYGFGISTVDMTEQADQAEAPPPDPNMEIVQQMDHAEREAYQEALHGPPPERDPDADPDEPIAWEPSGCRGEAEEAVRGSGRRLQDELGDQLQEMHERVQSDPRILQAEEAWAACMRDAGWDFDDRNDMLQYLSEQMNELRMAAQPDPDDVPGFGPGEEPPENWVPPPPPEPDPAALAELQEEELEIAADEWECTSEHIGENGGIHLEVYQEYEREFVEEHRDVLEELRE